MVLLRACCCPQESMLRSDQGHIDLNSALFLLWFLLLSETLHSQVTPTGSRELQGVYKRLSLTSSNPLCADVQYNLDGVSHLRGVMGCFSALGTVAFAYGGHNVVLEIQVSTFHHCSAIAARAPFACCSCTCHHLLPCRHLLVYLTDNKLTCICDLAANNLCGQCSTRSMLQQQGSLFAAGHPTS